MSSEDRRLGVFQRLRDSLVREKGVKLSAEEVGKLFEAIGETLFALATAQDSGAEGWMRAVQVQERTPSWPSAQKDLEGAVEQLRRQAGQDVDTRGEEQPGEDTDE